MFFFPYSKKKGITFLSFNKNVSFLAFTKVLISFSVFCILLDISLQEKNRRVINNNLKKSNFNNFKKILLKINDFKLPGHDTLSKITPLSRIKLLKNRIIPPDYIVRCVCFFTLIIIIIRGLF